MVNSNKGHGDDLDTDFDDLNDLPDFDDSDEGIFAPEPQKKKTSAQMSLIAGVAAIAVAGVAGYMFLLKPQATVAPEIASQLEPVVTPPDATSAVAASPVMAEPPQPEPQPEPPAVMPDAAVAPPVAESAPQEPAAQTPSPAEQALVDEPQAETTSAEPVTVTPPEPAPAAVVEQKVEQKAEEKTADTATEVAKAEPPEQPQEQAVPSAQPTAPAAEPAVTPPDQAALKTDAEEKKAETTTAAADIELPATADVPVPATEEQPAKGAEEKTVKKEDAKKKEVKKEQETLTYFDSPFGQSLRDIPPPSINPNVAPGESIIIVQKDMGSPEGVVVEKSPQTARIESQLVAGSRAVKLGRYDAALEIYNALYQMNPRDGRILMGRALTLQKMGEVAAAISGYEELLSLDPNNVDATVNLMGLIRKEYPAVALEKLLDLRQRYPNSSAIAAQLGVAYADAGNIDSALRYLGMASQMQPQNPLHLFNMAVIADRAGKREQAIGFYERALEIDAIYGTGRAFSRERVYDRLARLRGN